MAGRCHRYPAGGQPYDLIGLGVTIRTKPISIPPPASALLRARFTEVEGTDSGPPSVAGLAGLVDYLRLRRFALHRGDRIEARLLPLHHLGGSHDLIVVAHGPPPELPCLVAKDHELHRGGSSSAIADRALGSRLAPP